MLHLNNTRSASFEEKKDVSKCNKIFRPWDNADNTHKLTAFTETCLVRKGLDDSAQDATISTTTGNVDNEIPDQTHDIKCDNVSPSEDLKRSTKEFRKLETKSETFSDQRKTIENAPFFDYAGTTPTTPNEGCYPLYPELVHINLAHSLGLTPADPLFLEYVSQGCSVDEYARVINQEHQAKILNSRKQRPKKYRCPHCEVGFSNNGQLKGHIRIHTGERPFRCDENNCGKTFTRNEELTRHKRIHSGLRPFPCTHCGKRFGRKDHLKKHSRTHFQPRGVYAVPIMLPFESWNSSPISYPYVPMFTY